MMLVSGFRGCIGLDCWFVCVALGQRLWRSLVVESMLLALVVENGLFKVGVVGIGAVGWQGVRWRGMVYVGRIVGCWWTGGCGLAAGGRAGAQAGGEALRARTGRQKV